MTEPYTLSEHTFIVTGACVSYLFFKRYEPRNPFVWPWPLLGPPFVTAIALRRTSYALLMATIEHLFVLTLSIVFYRISPFHPLAKIPGPFVMKLSNVAMAYHTWFGKRYILIEELHKKYGPCVRIGPNFVSFVDAPAVKQLFGKGFPRSAGYRGHEPDNVIGDLVTVYSSNVPNAVEAHATRRALWNQGFTSAAVKEYDVFLNAKVSQLVEAVGNQAGSMDLGKWIGYFTFDVMGSLLCGGAFDMLRDGDKDGLWRIITEAMPFISVLHYVPWLGNILSLVPTNGDFDKLRQFSTSRARIRLENGCATRDLFHYFSGEGKDVALRPPQDQIECDMLAGIVAGADTTSSVLSNLFFCLMLDKPVLNTLRAEIEENCTTNEELYDAAKLSQLPYLNACINETLRLFPPLPAQHDRTIPNGSGGVAVSRRFFPEQTTVGIPMREIMRDPRYFYPNPEKFWPERWLESKNDSVILNRDAFIPFSSGPGQCIGKQLAYREMRLAVANLVQKYDMRLKEGFDPQTWIESLMDFGVTVKGPLPVTLTARSP